MPGYGYAQGSNFIGNMGAAAPSVDQAGLILNVDISDSGCYPGSGTAITDLSPSGNDMTIYNGATFDTEKGGCIVTDGVNDYIQTTANDIGDTNQAMSAFAYVKCTDLDTSLSGGFYYTWALNKRPATNNHRWQIYFYVSSADWGTYGYASLATRIGKGTSASVGEVLGWDEATVPQIHEDQWYYVGFTTDGVNGGTITMYVNGLAVGTGTLTDDRGLQSNKIRGASDGWSNTFGMPGKTKNYHVYNREVSASTVLNNYNAIK